MALGRIKLPRYLAPVTAPFTAVIIILLHLCINKANLPTSAANCVKLI